MKEYKITISDKKAPMLQSILDGVQKLVGKDMRVFETHTQEGKGASTRPRKPTKKERMAELDEMIITKTWRKPAHLKKGK